MRLDNYFPEQSIYVREKPNKKTKKNCKKIFFFIYFSRCQLKSDLLQHHHYHHCPTSCYFITQWVIKSLKTKREENVYFMIRYHKSGEVEEEKKKNRRWGIIFPWSQKSTANASALYIENPQLLVYLLYVTYIRMCKMYYVHLYKCLWLLYCWTWRFILCLNLVVWCCYFKRQEKKKKKKKQLTNR